MVNPRRSYVAVAAPPLSTLAIFPSRTTIVALGMARPLPSKAEAPRMNVAWVWAVATGASAAHSISASDDFLFIIVAAYPHTERSHEEDSSRSVQRRRDR